MDKLRILQKRNCESKVVDDEVGITEEETVSTRQKKVAVRVKMNFVSFRFLKLNFFIQGIKADRDKNIKTYYKLFLFWKILRQKNSSAVDLFFM
jgi:hypothetical protein